ncbi:autophagy-related protein 11-like [Lontra canadensis]|uniref:autophagy-related protein 11-like n=1 Tax=Lontra canadensis TaxID=76717 RepID=UPI0013F2CEEB|nr:autophagy-related protein 11-like [Lontra canadensis]
MHQPGPQREKGGEAGEVQPQARSPPRNGAAAWGGVGNGWRRVETPSGRAVPLYQPRKNTESRSREPAPEATATALHSPQTPADVIRDAAAGGSGDGAGGRFRSTRPARAADVGLRCARLPARPSAAQVAARSARWRPAAGRCERVRVRASEGAAPASARALRGPTAPEGMESRPRGPSSARDPTLAGPR